MRFGRVLAVLPFALSIGLTIAVVVLTVHKVWPHKLPQPRAIQAFWTLGALSVVSLLVAFLRRLPKYAGSLALDRAHKLSDRLTNALAFAALPEKEQTELMHAAIDDVAAHAPELSPRRAAPIRVPPEMAYVIVPLVALLFVRMLEIRTVRPVVTKPTIDALVMTNDDIELFREAARELERADQSPETKAAIERFNRLIEDLAEKRLDRTDAFRQMEAIERDLLQGAEADAKELEEQLKKTAEELQKSDLSKKIGDELKKNDLEKAEKEMNELAKKLKDKKSPPDKKALDRLREALEKASKRRKEALQAINEQRAEMKEQLLKKKKEVEEQKDPNKKREEERLLQKKERELERLDRQAEKQDRVGRQLDRLDRELAEAAQNLLKDMGLSAEDLQQAAEDLNRMQEEAMSQKDKEELKKRLEELREILRQQGQGGKERMKRMKSFARKARGGQPGESGEEGEGEGQGKGKPGQGEEGEGEEGEGQGKGKGKGKGKGDGPIEIGIGPGGAPIPMPGQGGPGDGPGDKPGDGPGQGGKEAGKGAGGPIAGNKTDPKMGTQDVEAQGLESNGGPTNSEVILSAAEKGFRGGDYKKVFTQYRTVAEENINKEQVPDGYRFYVQRYFQLIRPRE